MSTRASRRKLTPFTENSSQQSRILFPTPRLTNAQRLSRSTLTFALTLTITCMNMRSSVVTKQNHQIQLSLPIPLTTLTIFLQQHTYPLPSLHHRPLCCLLANPWRLTWWRLVNLMDHLPQRSISVIKTWSSVSTVVVKTMMLNHALTCPKLPRNALRASRLILQEKRNQKSWWRPWAFSWWWGTSFFLAFMGAEAQIHSHYGWIIYTPSSPCSFLYFI